MPRKMESRTSYVGMPVGQSAGIEFTNHSNIENCYAIGSITMPAGPTGATAAAGGGIAGYLSETTVSNCYTSVEITGAVATTTASGAVIGRCDAITAEIENCYYNADISTDDAGGVEGITEEKMLADAALTTDMAKLRLAATIGKHTGNAYIKTAAVGNDKYYPELAVFAARGSLGQLSLSGEPDGTKNRPYLISTAQDLWSLRNYLGTKSHNIYFALTNDIDVSGFLAENSPIVGREPIGIGTSTDGAAFCGSLDGRGYKITGLWSKPLVSYGPGAAGLFGVVARAAGADTVASVVTNPGNSVGTVTFKSGDTVPGVVTMAVYGNPAIATATLTVTLTHGVHTLTDVFSGSRGASAIGFAASREIMIGYGE